METQSGLPVGVAAFIGRERERAEVSDLVAATRVVTLTGSGGCGKTRLAMEIAGDVGSQFADGARWVELQSVRDPATVAAAVAEAVGVRERPGQTLVDTLAEQLREQHLLVVIDNCEHLVAACAALVGELTSVCARLHVLATSREPLAVQGETTFGVPPLKVPDADAWTARTVRATHAGQLFELRARQVRPDFVLTDDDAAAVATICRRLDGVPLAIELAAARMRVLAAAQIAAGLVDRFRLLTGGGRGVPARQRSLEASVAWSFGLLADTERLALARLSVFAGGFDLEAAQAVVAGPDIEKTAVLDLVTALADHSLVQVGEHHGRARYRPLETIRLFAQERLAELDDPARARDRHLDHYITLSERAGAGLAGADAQAWTARLAADISDLRTAMAWAVDSGRPLAVLDITEPTLRFWLERGRYVEMQRWLHTAVDAPAASDADRARGLLTTTLVMTGGGQLASAYGVADRAVGAARTVAAQATLALSLGLRAATGVTSGLAGSEEITADADEAVALAARLGDDATHSYVLTFTGGAAVGHGRSLGEGRRRLEQAVALCEDAAIGFHLPTAHALLGTWLPYCGEVDLAREHARRGVEWGRRIDRPGWQAVALSALAGADLLAGDVNAARGPLADAQALLRSRGLSPSLFEFMVGRCAALAAYRSGATGRARQVVEDQRRVAREHGARPYETWAVWLLGLLALTGQRPDDAREHFEQCRALSSEPRYPLTLGRALIGLSGLDEDSERAWELAHEGLAVLADFGDRVGTAEALETVAGLAVVRDHPDQALRLLAAAERFHDGTGIVRFPLAATCAARHVAAARAPLDEEIAKACWADGTGLSLDEAVAYARRGRGKRQRPESGWASLTPAEHDLVRLVAQGCTNAAIGERLFMSVNTVKKHLSHVYAKLEVDGRADLAAEVARRGL
jgi:predicted ATPase/DNA-binding CsgD family transcriptional regulator